MKSIYISDDLHQELRIKAAEKNVKLYEFLEEIIKNALQNEKENQEKSNQ